MQGHWQHTYPSIVDIEKSIKKFINAGVNVHITELDIDILPHPNQFKGGADIDEKYAIDAKLNPYTQGLPTKQQQKLTQRYVNLFKLFLKYDTHIERVTFWGLIDSDSWRNNFPIPGRVNYPLLFDREGKAKPAFNAVLGLKK